MKKIKKIITLMLVMMMRTCQLLTNFEDYYDNSCKNAVNNHSLGDKDLLFKKLRSYSGRSNLYERVVDVNLIQNLIDKLSDGKSAGHDQLLAEHLKYSHPVVIASIHVLFQILIACSHVPNAFGMGILIPIPKDETDVNHT